MKVKTTRLLALAALLVCEGGPALAALLVCEGGLLGPPSLVKKKKFTQAKTNLYK